MKTTNEQFIITAGDHIHHPVGPFPTEDAAHEEYRRNQPNGQVYLSPPTIVRLLRPAHPVVESTKVEMTRQPFRRFVAALRRPDGTFEQVSDYADSFATAERTIRSLYVQGHKNPRDPFKLVGSTVERITFDEYASQLPPQDFVDWD